MGGGGDYTPQLAESRSKKISLQRGEELRYINLVYMIPVQHIPPCVYVGSAFVLIFQVISVFPNVQRNERQAFVLCVFH